MREIAEAARVDFGMYCKVMLGKRFKEGLFTHMLIERAMQFYKSLSSGESPKMAIHTPPQHGKSTLIGQLFVAWLAGHNSEKMIGLFSAGLTLSRRNLRQISRLLTSKKHSEIFKGVRWGDINNAGELTNSNGGGVQSFSIGGMTTGSTVDICVIDDLIKSMQQATSGTQLESMRDWIDSVLLTRLSDPHCLLLISTIWTENDMTDYIKQKYDNFVEYRYAAIAEDNEYFDGVLVRRNGDALFPELKSIEFLRNQEKALEPSGVWDAMYQQQPAPSKKGMFRAEWFNIVEEIPTLEGIVIVGDTAIKQGVDNDFTVFTTAGIYRENDYQRAIILDISRGKYKISELHVVASDVVENACKYLKYVNGSSHEAPLIHAFMIEDKATGTGLIQSLRESKPANLNKIIPIPRSKSKLDRYLSEALTFAQNKISISSKCANIEHFFNEITKINKHFTHQHDDITDTIVDISSYFISFSAK